MHPDHTPDSAPTTADQAADPRAEGATTPGAGHGAAAGQPEHAHHEGHGGHEGHDGREGNGGHGGHGSHGGGHMSHHVAMFRRLFWIMLVLAIPTVFFDPMFAHLLGYHLPQGAWVGWVAPILGTVMYFWGGQPFLTGAWSEIKDRKPGMMLLIALAITTAFLASWASRLGLLPESLSFWWELALLVVIMLLGHWLEMRSLAETTSALDSLAALLPDEAERVEGDRIVTVAPSDLRVGDVVVVRPGASVPADGEIVDGSATFDESMVTGESNPVGRAPGDHVVAGTIATDSGVRVRVTAVGDDTTLAGIQKLVSDAQASSSKTQRLADRAAGWLFWYALGAAVLTAVVWTLLGQPGSALERAITVLVIACPHALGLAIPLVVSISTERAAKAGILIKDRLALEAMRTVDVVLFDKTGTLTLGKPSVTAVDPAAGVERDQLLAWAAAAESGSEHPLAKAIVAAARDAGVAVPAASDFASSPAVGVTATVDGATVRVGGPRLLEEQHAAPMPVARQWSDEGAIILHVVRDGRVVGALRLADEIRSESRQTVAALHKLGVEVGMITGDAEAVAQTVARELGIDHVIAGVRPEDKADRVAALQAQGRSVAMVGDGVNDAPALAQANVGLAIGAGTDVAISSAGVILASDDPRSVLSVIRLSQASYTIMRQNLWWAAGYNLITVPLAAGVLAPVGIVMPMSIGALLMSASTVVVALNAQRLRRLDLQPDAVVASILDAPAAEAAPTHTPAPAQH